MAATALATGLVMDTRLFAAALPEGHALYPVLASALRNRPVPKKDVSDTSPFWPASFFGLDRVTLFRDANEAERQSILSACGNNILAEAYYIEKCGMYFASKMCLLSESIQERMIYSLFGADEAVHFNWISSYAEAGAVKEFEKNPFIRLLDEVLRNEDRSTLSYVVQVILEGWGITHYHALAKHCLNPGLTGVIEDVIRDEGRHHASGLALFNEQPHGVEGLQRVTGVLSQLLPMVQAGPQMVVSEIQRVTNPLPEAQKTRVFAELDCETGSLNRINLFKSLIKGAAGADEILSGLEQRGCFRAYGPAECALVSEVSG